MAHLQVSERDFGSIKWPLASSSSSSTQCNFVAKTRAQNQVCCYTGLAKVYYIQSAYISSSGGAKLAPRAIYIYDTTLRLATRSANRHTHAHIALNGKSMIQIGGSFRQLSLTCSLLTEQSSQLARAGQ